MELQKVSSFIRSYIADDAGLLGEIYSEAVEQQVPVIRKETRELLKTQLLLLKPKNLLEIGTAVGYSALYMSKWIDKDAHITTIELSEERIAKAKKNILSMGKENQITVLAGDAADILPTLSDQTYDFIFVDAAKGQYIFYLPDVLRVSKPGALIFSDNILQDGDVLESHFTVEKRNRTIHDRMRDYIYALCNDKRIDTAVLSVADGVALSVRKRDMEESANAKL
ncbi:MAG: O-methyltransferase [Eubacteriales bacterium]|nr:O-methyltransferase [Lachnospiraceae bacterium]MDO5128023.1 O-methyltransferase [Eubacteriales bacterium]